MESSDIRYEVEGCVAIITVDRPEGLNAFSGSEMQRPFMGPRRDILSSRGVTRGDWGP